jgi:amino acid transporter
MALYGLGSMLGAGIYGLIGKAAGQAGNAVWLAFVIALLAALLTALSYASLGSRYPRAAGAAYVTERAYGFPLLSFVVGLALVCSGLTSIATQSRVFAANLTDLLGTDSLQIAWLALGFLLVLTGIVSAAFAHRCGSTCFVRSSRRAASCLSSLLASPFGARSTISRRR